MTEGVEPQSFVWNIGNTQHTQRCTMVALLVAMGHPRAGASRAPLARHDMPPGELGGAED